MKVYLVTSGDYSDYHILGAYSSRELAEEAQALFAADSIEDWDLDKTIDHPQGMLMYRVLMDIDGNVQPPVESVSIEYHLAPSWCPFGNKTTVVFYEWAEDETHAIKIAGEKRAELIAMNKWTTNWDAWKAAGFPQ